MAKKPDITTIATGYYSRQALNNNFEALRDGFDNTLSLDGSTPNAMEVDLDLNGNNIIGATGLLINGTDYLADVEAAKTAALVAQAAAETAETNAETAETNAESSETAAGLSATAAATSATASAASAVDATNNGAAQVALAAAQVTLAETAQTAAELAETNAETAESNAATSATNAATSATTASTGASTASTKASEAATSATNAATSATEAEAAKTGAEAARDSALAALDSFDDRYLGVKTTDPTVDNDGDALVVGAIYYNSNTGFLYVYNGTTWQITANAASGDLVSTNNLSDLTSPATARTNLGLGTAATTASTDYATAAQGALADSAIQSGDLATVATTGAYSDLTGLPTLGTAAATASTDYATAAQGVLADSAVQPNDSPTFAGLTTTANVSFGDNDKATFGAGSDLQIYHSGTHSYIDDGGTGNLYVRATNFRINNAGDTQQMFAADDGGAVMLFNNGGMKLATTSTGINVTGTVAATSFAGDGSSITGLPVTYVSQRLVTITSSQTFTLPANSRADIIAVGGGGSGGVSATDDDTSYSLVASGGGAGGACYRSVESSSAQNITIVIGAGGAAVSQTVDGASNGNAGGTTTVTGAGISLSAGGGGGGNGYYSPNSISNASVAGASGGTATGGILNYTGGSTGTITRNGTLRNINVGPGATIFGGDVPAITRSLLATNESQVNPADDYSSTSPVPTVTDDTYTSALGAYINNFSTTNLTVVCNAGSDGGGSGGGVCGPNGDSTTGVRRITGANGGDGFVLIKLYEELS